LHKNRSREEVTKGVKVLGGLRMIILEGSKRVGNVFA